VLITVLLRADGQSGLSGSLARHEGLDGVPLMAR
jgi:hypothetical protein